ncbi:MAG: hypothetical protein FWD31_12430, partial [Planctomycetaceae bacterium]|nr:hypothetical protein [Planctomycetaceae bacterium]
MPAANGLPHCVVGRTYRRIVADFSTDFSLPQKKQFLYILSHPQDNINGLRQAGELQVSKSVKKTAKKSVFLTTRDTKLRKKSSQVTVILFQVAQISSQVTVISSKVTVISSKIWMISSKVTVISSK